MRYECHVGHVYSEQSLATAKSQELEVALWTALRTLKETAAMYEGIATAPAPRDAGNPPITSTAICAMPSGKPKSSATRCTASVRS